MKKYGLMVIMAGLIALPFGAAEAAKTIVVDDFGKGCKLEGVWADNVGGNPEGTRYSGGGCVNADYHYTSKYGKFKKTGREKAIFTPDIPKAGKYKVVVTFRAGVNRSPKVTYEIVCAGGKTKKVVNQKEGDGREVLGTFEFEEGKKGHVAIISDGGSSACADSAQFTPAGDGKEDSESGQSGMDDVLGGGTRDRDHGQAVSGEVDLKKAGTKNYTFESDGVAKVTPYLETRGEAGITVTVKKADGTVVKWMEWSRENDADPSKLIVDGKEIEASMKEVAPGDFSPGDPGTYKYEAKKGDTIVLKLEGEFGKASPYLKFVPEVKK